MAQGIWTKFLFTDSSSLCKVVWSLGCGHTHTIMSFLGNLSSQVPLKRLVKTWTNRYPDAKMDPMNIWDDIITNRWDVVSFLKFPELFCSQTVVEQCGVWALRAPVSTEVVPSAACLPVCDHVPCPSCAGWWAVDVLGGERRQGGPSASGSGLPDRERHPDFSALLCTICLTSPGLRLSASLETALGGPQADTCHTYPWEEQGQRGYELFYAVSRTKGLWPLQFLFLPLDPVSSGTTAFQRFTFNTFCFSNFFTFYFETILFFKKITRKVALLFVPFSQIHGFLKHFK